jgi:hypothetical protein
MKTMHSATTALQGSLNMNEVRFLFDEFIELFPSVSCYLSKTARIIHSSIFENAFVKIIRDIADDLTEIEKFKLENFITKNIALDLITNRDESLLFAENSLKRARNTIKPKTETFDDLSYIPTTSNRCERLLTKQKLPLNI